MIPNLQTCRVCSCTDTTPCMMHTAMGTVPCWWEELNLCSHCKLKETGTLIHDDPEFRQILKLPFRIDSIAGEAFMLISLLQLVVKHPSVKDELKQFAVSFGRGLQAQVSLRPDIAVTLEAGWDEAFDVPSEVVPERRIILPGE